MNRLCLGALGLLVLAVSCYAGHGHPKNNGAIILGDYKEAEDKDYGKNFKLSDDQKIQLSRLLREKAEEKYDFVIEATKYLYFSKTDVKVQKEQEARKKEIIGKLSKLSASSLDGSPEKKLEALEKGDGLIDFETPENRRDLRALTAELFLSLAMYVEREDENIDMAKIDEGTPLGQVMAELKQEIEKLDPKKKGEVLDAIHNIEFESHSPDWNKAKWDKEYGSLPSIAKYFANGLHPTKKQRLHRQLAVAEEKGLYLKKKEESQKHIDHIAVKARLEAISHSHTAAGEYFANHENWIKTKLDELYEDHKNKDINRSEMLVNNPGMGGHGH